MIKAVILTAAISLMVGCSGDDNNTTNNSTTGGTTNTTSNTTSNTTGGTNTGGSGEFLRASGTFNGAAFSVECDPDDAQTSSFTSGFYLGHDACYGAAGSHQIQCATTEEGIGGVMGTIVVNIGINTAADDTVSVSGSLETVNNLNASSPNLAESTVTIDTFEPTVGASGSFTASWTDDGSPVFGDVTGTFNFNCDE